MEVARDIIFGIFHVRGHDCHLTKRHDFWPNDTMSCRSVSISVT